MPVATTVKATASGYHVSASGDTSGETDSIAIESATAAIAATGKGGTLTLGGGLWIAGPIMVRGGLTVRGPGWQQPIQLANGSNSAMLIADDFASWFRVSNLHLDGRRENQTGGSAAVEVMTKFGKSSTPVPPASCSWPGLYDVMVSYAYGDSFHLEGVETRAEDCFSFRPGGHGYVLDQTDQFLRTCTSGESFGDGFLLRGSEHQLVQCKAWWSGWQANRGSAAGKVSGTLKTATAVDFRLAGFGSHQLTATHAQDGAKHGYSLESPSNNVKGRAGRIGHEGLVDGVVLNVGSTAHNNVVDIVQDDATANYVSSATKAMTAIHASAVGNDIRINGFTSATGTLTRAGDDTTGGATGGTTGRNKVILGRDGLLTPVTYAATITPNPINDGGISSTLTGNVTIANPPADTKTHGKTFDVVLTQDATGGRTVAFGTDYKGAAAAVTAANAVSHWTFRCVKTVWVQESFRSY